MKQLLTILSTLLLVCFTGLSFAQNEVSLPAPNGENTALPTPTHTGTCNVHAIAQVPAPHYKRPRYFPYPEMMPTPLDRKSPLQKILTLKEAILLALRNNPAVINAELTRVTDKFALQLAHYAFEPQFTFNANATVTNKQKPIFTAISTMNLNTPIGTQISIDYINDLRGSAGVGTLTINQPLLRGAGYAVNTVQYYNSIDQEASAKLAFKGSLITVVQQVITSYRTLVQDYNNLDIAKQNLKITMIQVNQYTLQVKAGKIAPSELLQQQANLETSRLSVIQAENSVEQDYEALLRNLGLVPMAKIDIVKKIDVSNVRPPRRDIAIQLAIDNNISYQQALLAIRQTERDIITARDNRRMALNLVATTTAGDSISLSRPLTRISANSGPTVSLNLNVPIDDLPAKSALASAEIALEQQKLTLQQQKEDLIRTVINSLNQIDNEWRQIVVAEKQVVYQQKTLEAAQIRQRYGKTTAFEVVQLQDQLLQQQTSLVSTKIAYLNDITSLNSDMGITLDVWNIQLRY